MPPQCQGRVRASCARTGGARWPGAGAAREEAPAGSLRAKCPRGDPSPATSSRKGPGGTTRCTGTGPARGRPPSTGPIFAKCPDTVVPAKPRIPQLGLAGSVAGASPGIARRAELQKALPHGASFCCCGPQDEWSDLSAVAQRAKAEAIPIISSVAHSVWQSGPEQLTCRTQSRSRFPLLRAPT